MDGESRSPYPHHSWLAQRLSVVPPRVFDVQECRHVTHHLLLTMSGEADIVRTSQGVQQAYHSSSGAIGFFPRDNLMHALAITTAAGFVAYDVLIPTGQIRAVGSEEGLRPALEFQAVPDFRDTLMRASLVRLATRTTAHQVSEEIGDEVAARQILLRLCALCGAGIPEWWKDASVFTPIIMRQLVASIDAQLGVPVSLETMADTVRLSPGHFARKFHHSAGLSLQRFINTRRIAASFAPLREGMSPLTEIALELGFSSQSHFTRLFSGLTGLSPDQFRRPHRRMLG